MPVMVKRRLAAEAAAKEVGAESRLVLILFSNIQNRDDVTLSRDAILREATMNRVSGGRGEKGGTVILCFTERMNSERHHKK